MLDVLQVADLYLMAKANTQSQFTALEQAWYLPAVDAAVAMLAGLIKSDKNLNQIAQQHPEVMSILQQFGGSHAQNK